MIDFEMDFLTILAPFWDPSWGHVGSIFGQNQGEIDQKSIKKSRHRFFIDFFDFSSIFDRFWTLKSARAHRVPLLWR